MYSTFIYIIVISDLMVPLQRGRISLNESTKFHCQMDQSRKTNYQLYEDLTTWNHLEIKYVIDK